MRIIKKAAFIIKINSDINNSILNYGKFQVHINKKVSPHRSIYVALFLSLLAGLTVHCFSFSKAAEEIAKAYPYFGSFLSELSDSTRVEFFSKYSAIVTMLLTFMPAFSVLKTVRGQKFLQKFLPLIDTNIKAILDDNYTLDSARIIRNDCISLLRLFAGDASRIGFRIITGLPGSGKTFVVQSWLSILDTFGWDVGLIDPDRIDGKFLTKLRAHTALLIEADLDNNASEILNNIIAALHQISDVRTYKIRLVIISRSLYHAKSYFDILSNDFPSINIDVIHFRSIAEEKIRSIAKMHNLKLETDTVNRVIKKNRGNVHSTILLTQYKNPVKHLLPIANATLVDISKKWGFEAAELLVLSIALGPIRHEAISEMNLNLPNDLFTLRDLFPYATDDELRVYIPQFHSYFFGFVVFVSYLSNIVDTTLTRIAREIVVRTDFTTNTFVYDLLYEFRYGIFSSELNSHFIMIIDKFDNAITNSLKNEHGSLTELLDKCQKEQHDYGAQMERRNHELNSSKRLGDQSEAFEDVDAKKITERVNDVVIRQAASNFIHAFNKTKLLLILSSSSYLCFSKKMYASKCAINHVAEILKWFNDLNMEAIIEEIEAICNSQFANKSLSDQDILDYSQVVGNSFMALVHSRDVTDRRPIWVAHHIGAYLKFTEQFVITRPNNFDGRVAVMMMAGAACKLLDDVYQRIPKATEATVHKSIIILWREALRLSYVATERNLILTAAQDTARILDSSSFLQISRTFLDLVNVKTEVEQVQKNYLKKLIKYRGDLDVADSIIDLLISGFSFNCKFSFLRGEIDETRIDKEILNNKINIRQILYLKTIDYNIIEIRFYFAISSAIIMMIKTRTSDYGPVLIMAYSNAFSIINLLEVNDESVFLRPGILTRLSALLNVFIEAQKSSINLDRKKVGKINKKYESLWLKTSEKTGKIGEVHFQHYKLGLVIYMIEIFVVREQVSDEMKLLIFQRSEATRNIPRYDQLRIGTDL